MKKIYLIGWLMLALGAVDTQAQQSAIAIGDWQLHLPYNRAKAVADAGDKVYCATEDGFFYLDKATNSTAPVSKLDGLHDFDISTIGYDQETQTLLIAYENTNIDLIRGNQIININDILRKSMTGVKTIYHVNFHNKLAYLSCSFGVVVLDLVKLEVKDSYSNLGPSGEVIKVFGSTILNDSIYLATNRGIRAARRTNNNLLDYSNWSVINAGLPDDDIWERYKNIGSVNNKIYAGVNGKGLYYYNGSSWHRVNSAPHGPDFFDFKATQDKLLVASQRYAYAVTRQHQVELLSDPLVEQPRAIDAGSQNNIWIGDLENGLIKYNGQSFEAYTPNGPAFPTAFSILPDPEGVYVTGGGYIENFTQRASLSGFYRYHNGQWENFNTERFPSLQQFPDERDFVDVTRNPVNGKLYFATYGGGVVEWSGVGEYRIFDDHTPGSTLRPSIPGEDGYTRIASVEADNAGNVWMVQRITEFSGYRGLHVLRPDGTFQSFSTGHPSENDLQGLLIDDNGYKWMNFTPYASASARGIIVYDDKTNQMKHLSNINDAALPGPIVYSMAKDREGAIWVGTDNGIGIFNNPGLVFTDRMRAADKPIIGGRYLLEGQQVKAIAVDGGNRKWMGTSNGLWLFNESGDELIHHFTTENSPLPSDKVNTIAIDHNTGEVFVGTEAGLVSYRGTATITEGEPACAEVFPNPVRKNFNGLVGVSGAPNNSVVKITDITGTLVYETQSAGGTAVWNVADYNGERVKPGVYLVYFSTPEGDQTCISKIAVLE